jgi:hypothetical protein
VFDHPLQGPDTFGSTAIGIPWEATIDGTKAIGLGPPTQERAGSRLVTTDNASTKAIGRVTGAEEITITVGIEGATATIATTTVAVTATGAKTR